MERENLPATTDPAGTPIDRIEQLIAELRVEVAHMRADIEAVKHIAGKAGDQVAPLVDKISKNPLLTKMFGL